MQFDSDDLAVPAKGEIRLLGRFSVRRDGREIDASAFGGGQTRALVRILLTRRGELVPRDVLIDALWPRQAPADPGASLNVLVNRARRALGGPSPLETGSGGYVFAGEHEWSVDAEEFLRSVEQGRVLLATGDSSNALAAFRAALDRWAGEPLPEDSYADWAQGYRAEVLRAYQECLEGGATAAISERAVRDAVVLAHRAVVTEPLREAANLVLVRALAASGDQAGALAAFDEFRDRLGEDLGLEPSHAAFELQSRVIRHDAAAPVDEPEALTRSGGPGFALGFVGRDTEVAAIRVKLDRETNPVAVVAGRSGAGKSRLLAEVTATLGAPVIHARAYFPERDEPWSVVRALLREVVSLYPDVIAALPARTAVVVTDLVPEAEPVEHATPVLIDAASRRALTTRGVLQMLRPFVDDNGVVVVDDLQWADTSSIELLRLAHHELPSLRSVLAYRPEEVGSQSAVAQFLAGRDVVQVDALPGEAIARLVADADLVEVLATSTDGTPFAVVEVMRTLWEQGLLSPGAIGAWRTTSPAALTVARDAAEAGQRRSVEQRVEQHPASRRDLLGLVALLSREVPARLVARALGNAEAEVLDDLDALTRTDLVRLGDKGWATAHDLVRETVIDDLEPGTAARLHTAIVRALEAEDVDPAEVARHARSAGDPTAAARYFSRASAQRLHRMANDDAIALADQGLELQPTPTVRAELLEARAEACARRGDLNRARTDLREAMNLLGDGPPRSRVLSRLAMLAFGAEDMLRAEELVEVALAAAGSDVPTRAHALAVGALTDMNLGRPDRADARAEEALRLFERAGDPNGVADILDGRAMAGFLAGNITDALGAFDRVARLFEDAGNLLRVVTPRSTRGHGLLFAARFGEAVQETSAALELAGTLGSPELQAYALWHRSESLSGLGRVAEAGTDAEAALSLARGIGHRGWTTTALLALGLARHAGGDLDAAEQAFDESLVLAEHLGLFASWGASRLAAVLIDRGELDRADLLVGRALEQGPELAHYEARLVQARLAQRRGDSDVDELVPAAIKAATAGGHHWSVQQLALLR